MLNVEDNLEDFYEKWQECEDIIEIYGNEDVEKLILDLFLHEIIEKNLEEKFEKHMLHSFFSLEDLRYTNRIKELVHYLEIEKLEIEIEKNRKNIESLEG